MKVDNKVIFWKICTDLIQVFSQAVWFVVKEKLKVEEQVTKFLAAADEIKKKSK